MVKINEIRIDQQGRDDNEFFELVREEGDAASLDGLTYVVVGGNRESVIREFVTFGPEDVFAEDGYFVVSELADADKPAAVPKFDNDVNVTHLLVEGFNSGQGESVDSNSDGTVDEGEDAPWTDVVDSVALAQSEGGELTYSPNVVRSTNNNPPPYIFRSPDATGAFEVGTLNIEDDTPGEANPAGDDTEDPGTEDPGTEDPGTGDPGTEDPGTEDPGTEDPGTEDPGTEDPGTEDPGTEDPGTEDPGTEDPGTEDPGTEDPDTDTFEASEDGSSVEVGDLGESDAVQFSLDDIDLDNASEIRVFDADAEGSDPIGSFSVLAGGISSAFAPTFSLDADEDDNLRFELVDEDGNVTNGVTSVGEDGNATIDFGGTTLSLAADDGTGAEDLVESSGDGDGAAVLNFSNQAGTTSTVEFTVFREAAYDSTVGLYTVDTLTGGIEVDDGQGGTNTVNVGDDGYAEAALNNAIDLTLSTSDGNSTTSTATVDNQLFGTFITVEDPDFETVQTYFSFEGANGGNDHVKQLGSNAIGFEDLPGLGDADFNDLVVTFEVQTTPAIT